jgi:hypothetical protein
MRLKFGGNAYRTRDLERGQRNHEGLFDHLADFVSLSPSGS